MSPVGSVWSSLAASPGRNRLSELALFAVVPNPDSSRAAREVGANTETLGPVKQLLQLWVVGGCLASAVVGMVAIGHIWNSRDLPPLTEDVRKQKIRDAKRVSLQVMLNNKRLIKTKYLGNYYTYTGKITGLSGNGYIGFAHDDVYYEGEMLRANASCRKGNKLLGLSEGDTVTIVGRLKSVDATTSRKHWRYMLFEDCSLP